MYEIGLHDISSNLKQLSESHAHPCKSHHHHQNEPQKAKVEEKNGMESSKEIEKKEEIKESKLMTPSGGNAVKEEEKVSDPN